MSDGSIRLCEYRTWQGLPCTRTAFARDQLGVRTCGQRHGPTGGQLRGTDRNGECACGSGRKAKRCCYNAPEPHSVSRARPRA